MSVWLKDNLFHKAVLRQINEGKEGFGGTKPLRWKDDNIRNNIYLENT